MILCTLHQWLWSCACDDGRAVPALTRRHLKRCAACRASVAAMQELDAKFGQEQPVAPDERWQAEVMRAVRSTARPQPQPVMWPLPVTLAAALTVVVLVALLKKESLTVPSDRTAEQWLGLSLVSVAGEMTRSLENEGAALEQDLQQALQIATSCLPF